MWRPTRANETELDALIGAYRELARSHLRPLVDRYCDSLVDTAGGAEYRKLIELSTKMQIVGRAWTEIAGYPFDDRRERIASLFGACCYFGDSFLDDFGEAASRDYIERFEVFLTRGWFEVRNDLERAFYVVVTRLFRERDVFRPMLRQAMWSLYEVQKLDVLLSLDRRRDEGGDLTALRNCGRDRSGHAITVLALLLVPDLPLAQHHVLYMTGALISYVDDYGDVYYDRVQNKATYMNTVANARGNLTRTYRRTLALVDERVDRSHGRELLKTFLYRYYTSRLRKHEHEKLRQDNARPVYA